MSKNRYIFGKWEEDISPLTALDAIRICEEGASCRRQMAGYPLDRIFSVLLKARKKWMDPEYALRREAKELLPDVTGFSREMVELGLEELCWMLDPKILRKKIYTELRGIPRIGDYYYDPSSQTALRWYPLGTVLHVLAGNVFIGAAGSLIEGLITGNVTILKMPGSEQVFLPLLIRSIIECDEDGTVSGSIALVNYASSQSDVIAEFKKRVDGIVVWGGEEAVRAYRDGLPARTRLIIFGPKLSLAVVTEKGLMMHGLKTIAGRLANDIAIWDQNACTAPQVCYVQGMENAVRLAEELSFAMEATSETLPPGRLEMDQAVEIRKARTVFEVAEAKGEGLLKESRRGLDWTVIVDRNKAIEPSPLHRTIRLVPYENIREVEESIEAMRGYIQTVGLASDQSEQWDLSARFGASGALRVVEAGRMAVGEIDDPHDGSYDLHQLMHLVVTRLHTPSEDLYPADLLPDAERIALINERLRVLLARASESEFYKNRLEGLSVEGVDDLERIPVLTREEMEVNMPPQGTGMSTGPYFGGYVSRSGGSTGTPKFSVYDDHDWEAMISHAVRILRAAGLERQDRLANCLLAGDLYGSFVSFDHINVRIGVTTFAFAGSARPEVFLDMWRKFGINAIMGTPSTIVPLLRKVKEIEPSFTIEKVIYAGSPMSKMDRGWIASVLKARRIASVIGANDGGQIAYQCRKMEGAIHHTIDDFNYLEIVDDLGRRVPDGTMGRILITSLLKYAFPLIRYAIGDQGRIVPGLCPCGRRARVLEYLGRADDVISVGNLNLRYRDIRNALEDLPISEVQVVARSNEVGDYLALCLESSAQSVDLKSRVHQALIKKVKNLEERLKDGSLQRIEVEIEKPGSIPRNPRTGKVREIIDERI